MKIEWNEQQDLAIKHRGENLLLSAGAGSGKTAVLTQRIVSLVLEGVPLKRLLVMTFTKAAASEMRQRISKQLEIVASHNNQKDTNQSDDSQNNINYTDEEIKRARFELNNFGQANVSTIDSFCTKVLRRHFNEAEIDPNFRIADEHQAQLMMRKCIENVLEKAYSQEDTTRLELLESAFCDYRNPIDSLLLSVYYFMHSLAEPWQWLQKSVDMYDLSFDKFLESDAIKDIIQNNKKLAEEALQSEKLVQSAAKMALDSGDRVTDNFVSGINEDVVFLQDLVDVYSTGDTAQAFSDIPSHKFATFAGFKSADDDIRDEHKNTKDIIKTLRKSSEVSIQKQHANICAMRPALECLQELLVDFHIKYTNAKLDKRLLDFSDLSHKTLKVVKNKNIANEYKSRYRGIFIDEYQDSNLVQETIINKIAVPNSLFYVGDVKQSIYRFRSAEPSLFMSRSKKYSNNNGGTRIDLTANYRSAENIIHGVNDVFSRVMPTIGNLEYGDSEKLVAGKTNSEPKKPIKIILMINDAQESEEENQELADLSSFEKEALAIAHDIQKRMLEPICDGKKNAYRKLNYSDIVILSRTGKGNAETLTRIFTSEGIPAFAALSRGYFEALEVEVFINLLKAIDNKRNDLALLSIMRSGIAGFTDEDIVDLRKNYPRNTHKSIYDAFIASCDENTSLAEHSRALFMLLAEAKKLSNAVRIDQLLRWLIEKCNYDIMISAMPLGSQRLANVEKLVDHSRAFESYSSGGLNGFLRFIEDLRDSGRDMGEAVLSGEGSDSVRIMTIHNSKGLEFPIVYICDTGKSINTSDTTRKLMMHRKLGIGASYFDLQSRYRTSTLYQDAISARILEETIAEELRMLYVAMTRAEEELCIYGSVNAKFLDSKIRSWVNKTGKKSFLDFIMDSVLSYPGADKFRESLDISVANSEEYLGIWDIGYKKNFVQELASESKLEKEKYKTWVSSAQKQDYSEIQERYAWSYPITTVPSKTTVSNIAAGRLSFDETPKFIAPTHMTAADRGVAVHLALEHLDWNQDLTRTGINNQISNLLENEIMTTEQAESVDIELLVKFCSSDFAQRIIVSETLRREWPFTAIFSSTELFENQDEQPSDVVLQGVIDAAFWENDGWVIVDYKSDRIFDTSEKAILELAEKHKKQVYLYSQALNRITRQKVNEGYIYLLNAGEAVKVI